MNDAILGFIGGLFCGGLLGLVVAALVSMGARETEKELDDGVDEVLGKIKKGFEEELDKRAKEKNNGKS